ncbi:MAG: FAD-dependent oxidoreductase [Desulfobacterales bacterium]
MTNYRQKNWWLQSLPQDIVPDPSLECSRTADVTTIIIGGYNGLSAGYHLKILRPELNVCLLESDICGYGASGRNGGFSMTTQNGRTIAELICGHRTDRTNLFFVRVENPALAR